MEPDNRTKSALPSATQVPPPSGEVRVAEGNSRNEVNEVFFWDFVSNVNYPANHENLEDCIDYLQTFSVEKQKQLRDENYRLKGELYEKYFELDTGDIYLSDDRFSDALSYAVSLGEYEYYTILNEESYFLDYLLQGYNKNNGFCESFDYVFNDVLESDDSDLLEDYKEYGFDYVFGSSDFGSEQDDFWNLFKDYKEYDDLWKNRIHTFSVKQQKLTRAVDRRLFQMLLLKYEKFHNRYYFSESVKMIISFGKYIYYKNLDDETVFLNFLTELGLRESIGRHKNNTEQKDICLEQIIGRPDSDFDFYWDFVSKSSIFNTSEIEAGNTNRLDNILKYMSGNYFYTDQLKLYNLEQILRDLMCERINMDFDEELSNIFNDGDDVESMVICAFYDSTTRGKEFYYKLLVQPDFLYSYFKNVDYEGSHSCFWEEFEYSGIHEYQMSNKIKSFFRMVIKKRNNAARVIQLKFLDWFYKPICKDGTFGLNCFLAKKSCL
jgi:hypothetical protein